MKKIAFLILLIVSPLLTGCNQQTIESYNETIVLAHTILLDINNDFYGNCKNFLGKPESKKELLQLIEKTKKKLTEARKPVEALVPFEDHGMRSTILEMYSDTEDAMYLYAAKADVITEPDSREAAAFLFAKEHSKLEELDKLIRELQVQYAYYNKCNLR